ncbi:MAG: tetratricopeptide repeat protein [Candidatus Omnitrophica bacterium]|nr:tetratricopeptide repeat protein [Candidatus Omnitrophota bacterium]
MSKNFFILSFLFFYYICNFSFAKERDVEYFKRGYQFYQKEDYKNAAFCCKRCLKANPNNFDCNFLLAKIYSEKGKTKASIKYLLRSKNLKPDDYRVWLSLGSIYKSKNELKIAKEYLNKAILLNPYSAASLIELADLYLKEKNYIQTIIYANKGVKLNTEDAWGYYILGIAYLNIDDKENALSAYNKLKDLDKNLADKLLRKIKYNNFYKKIKD